MRTTVYGTIYDSSGSPYKGAIVKFLPNAPFKSDREWIQDVEVRAVTNSYGRFEVELPPTSGENFYFLTVVYDKTTTRTVVIPKSDSPIDFLELEKYLFPYERMEMLGDC